MGTFSDNDIWELSELKMEPLALAAGMKALEEEQMLWRPGVQVEFVAIFVAIFVGKRKIFLEHN